MRSYVRRRSHLIMMIFVLEGGCDKIVVIVIAASHFRLHQRAAHRCDPGPLCGIINLGRGWRPSSNQRMCMYTNDRIYTYIYVRGGSLSLNLISQVESLSLSTSYLNIGSRLADVNGRTFGWLILDD